MPTVRMHEIASDGMPVECSGEYLTGDSFHAIVERMMLNPFCNGLTVREYLESSLAGFGISLELPDEAEEASAAFFLALEKHGFARIGEPPVYSEPVGIIEDDGMGFENKRK